MTEGAVRDALATAVATVSGLRASAYAVDQVQPPMALIVPDDFDPRMVFAEGKTVRNYKVILHAARAATEASQKLLDSYCELAGSGSVIAAIQGASALNDGSTADYASVTNVSGLEVSTQGAPATAAEYFTRTLDVEVCF